MQSAIYIDGEAPVLSLGMNPDVVKLYRDNQIHGVKGVPYGTDRHQAWDDSTNFMNMHSGVKKVQNESTDCTNHILRASLQTYYSEFDAAFPLIKLSKSFKDKCTHGNEVVVHCAQNGNVSGPKLKKAFVNCGQVVPINKTAAYQYPGFESKTTIDVRRILGLCGTPISNDEQAHFESNIEQLVDSARTYGKCLDELMDNLNIMKTEGTKSRATNVCIYLT